MQCTPRLLTRLFLGYACIRARYRVPSYHARGNIPCRLVYFLVPLLLTFIACAFKGCRTCLALTMVLP